MGMNVVKIYEAVARSGAAKHAQAAQLRSSRQLPSRAAAALRIATAGVRVVVGAGQVWNVCTIFYGKHSEL